MRTLPACLVLVGALSVCAACHPAPSPDSTTDGPAPMDAGDGGSTAADASTDAASPADAGQVAPIDFGAIGDPAGHTQADVCARYTESAAVAPAFFSKSAATCDPGTLTAAGVGNAVARVSFHRWLAGLAPVTASDASNELAQACALVSAWNPAGQQAHSPPSSSQCYTSDGAQGAGSSNIAWGSNDPVAAIDQWVDDSGNETTMGHRRWILNPPLDPIGFGLYIGGDAGYGAAACLVVFDQSGTGPRPAFVAYPPPGYVPVALTQTTWTYSADNVDFTSPTITVTRLSDGAKLGVTIQAVSNPGGPNYPNATSFVPSGWSPAVGETYRVTVSAGGTTQSYDVKPVDC